MIVAIALVAVALGAGYSLLTQTLPAPPSGAAPTVTFTSPACGQAPVSLASAASFAVLAGSTVTSTGLTTVTGDLGVSPGTAVTGFPPGTVVGTIHAGDPTAAWAIANLTIAYNDAAGRTLCPVSVSGNLGGLTLIPGLYKSTSSLEISSGDLTLDAQGNASAVFIFQMASTLVTTSGRQVILTGGAQASNIFWQVGSSATFGTTSSFMGTVMADQSITLATGATLNGRALARIGAVTMDTNTVSFATGQIPDTTPPLVTSTSPVVAVAVNSNISATFSEAMNPSTITVSTFLLKQGTTPVSGLVSYAGLTATFNPATDLASNTTYTATITTGAKDLAGNALASDFVWNFTTGQISDTTPPRFSVLAGTAVTCTDSTVTGDVGVYPGTAVTQTNCPITGTIHAGDPAAAAAVNDFLGAYDALALVACDTVLTGTLDGVTLAPGVYCFDAAATLTGVLTLDGPANGIWTFKIGTLGTGALTGTGFSVVMAGGGQPYNVYWWVAEAATLTDSNFVGTILAGRAITITRGTFTGDALAKAAVTMTGTDLVGC